MVEVGHTRVEPGKSVDCEAGCHARPTARVCPVKMQIERNGGARGRKVRRSHLACRASWAGGAAGLRWIEVGVKFPPGDMGTLRGGTGW